MKLDMILNKMDVFFENLFRLSEKMRGRYISSMLLLHMHFLSLFPQILLLLSFDVVIQFASLSEFFVFFNLKCVLMNDNKNRKINNTIIQFEFAWLI